MKIDISDKDKYKVEKFIMDINRLRTSLMKNLVKNGNKPNVLLYVMEFSIRSIVTEMMEESLNNLIDNDKHHLYKEHIKQELSKEIDKCLGIIIN